MCVCVCCAQCSQHFILTNKITTYCHYLQQLKVPIWTGSLTAFALYRFSPFWNSSALPLAKQEYNLQHTGNVICSTTCVHVRCSQCHDTVFRPGFKDKMLLITIHMCLQFGINDNFKFTHDRAKNHLWTQLWSTICSSPTHNNQSTCYVTHTHHVHRQRLCCGYVLLHLLKGNTKLKTVPARVSGFECDGTRTHCSIELQKHTA